MPNGGRLRDPGLAAVGESLAGSVSEQAWLEVIHKMDEVYHELIEYEVELEQKNSALEDSQRFIRSVLTSMSDIVMVCDRAGVIEDLNPSLLELTGRNESALRGISCLELFADDASRQVMENYLLGVAPPAFSDCELLLHGANGQVVPVALSCTPRANQGGRAIGMVITGRPVGELRRAYSALRQAHEDLKKTQQQLLHSEKMAALGRLVAGVAHELNNPISFVLGNVVALKKYLARIERYLEAVHEDAAAGKFSALRQQLRVDRTLADLPSLIDGTIEGAERTRDVVDSLKRFSAPGGDEDQAVDLRAIVERAVHWVSGALPDDFNVSLDLPDTIPVTGNAGQIQQVVMNLVQNAADATSGRNPGVLQIAVHEGSEAGTVAIDFADNGPGIADGHLPNIFDPFFTTKPVGKGTGLGLSISYGIVSRHGGRLSARNQGPAGGAVFTLQLPLRSQRGI